jgi:hypothetical protein
MVVKMNKNKSKILPKDLKVIADIIFGNVIPPHDLTEAISRLYNEYETTEKKELSKQDWKHFWD